MTPLPPPQPDEYAAFYASYVAEATAAGADVIAVLESQRSLTAALGNLPESVAAKRYQPDKWSVKEIVGHLADGERVFCYRAMRFARGDATPVEGFDEKAYTPAARYDRRTIAQVADELAAVHEASIALFRTFDAEEGARWGEANGSRCTVRALAWFVAGHFLHHMTMLRERYGIAL
ncbi:MAG: DinB family protein [Gemmatimonadales bacterium]